MSDALNYHTTWILLQIPDVRTGENIIDAVIVDEESIGLDRPGSGAKILYGKGALERYLSGQKVEERKVESIYIIVINHIKIIHPSW